MFTKLNVTQSMLDAVNSVLSEKKMDEADLDETGLRKAAYAAHSAGQKMFSFKGKTYPVRIQGEDITYGEAVQEEVEELDEAMSGEVTRTKTGLVHRSTKAYGGSKPEKHVVDTLKGPKTKDLIKKDVEDEKKTRGQYDEELKGDQHKIDANKNNKIDSQDFAILRGKKKVKEDMHFAKKLIEGMKRSDIPASVRKARGDAPLTPAEVKAPSKDSISASANLAKARNEETELDEASCDTAVKKHEKKMHGKDGEVAKHVDKMHKEDVEQIDEKNVPTSPDKWASAKAAAKSKFAVYPSAYANAWASKKYKSMGGGWKSAKEEVEFEEEMIDEKAGYSAKAARAGKDIGKPGKAFGMIAKKAGERYGSAEAGKRVAGAILAKLRKEDEDWSDEDIDALLEVYELEERHMTDAEMKKREDIVKGMKKGLAGFKSRYGARAKDVMYATATKQAMKEGAIEDAPAITTDTLAGRLPGGKANTFKSYKLRVKPFDKEGAGEVQKIEVDKPEVTPASKSIKSEATIAGTPGWKKMAGTVTDKSGAKHSPMSRARDLAQQAFKKVQDKTKIK